VLDLVAQMAHMDIDRLLVLIERLIVAQQLEQLAARVDPTRPRSEVTEDLEFRGSERDPPRSALHAASLEVDEQIPVTNDAAPGSVREVSVRTTKKRLDPTHQLAKAEGLGEVVIGAELETDDLVDLVVARGQDENRRLRAARAQP